MNIENIASLSLVLSKAGFDNLSYKLLQFICCRPPQFSISQSYVFGSDHLHCSIRFDRKGEEYIVSYYDAGLLKELAMPELTINQVSLQQLEAAMQEVDWKLSEPPATFRMNDESTWKREKEISRIVAELAKLSAVPEGKMYADALKLRFWSGTMLEELNGSLGAVRSRLEVSQRFYFINGEGISVSEAWRFLQNRWMEKKLLAMKKTDGFVTSGNQQAGEGKLLKKKRIVKTHRQLK